MVRQAALPQPQSGRERREEVVVEKGEEQWPAGGWGDVQSSESYMLQERQEEYLREEEHYPESRRSRAVSRGKNRRPGSGHTSIDIYFV